MQSHFVSITILFNEQSSTWFSPEQLGTLQIKEMEYRERKQRKNRVLVWKESVHRCRRKHGHEIGPSPPLFFHCSLLDKKLTAHLFPTLYLHICRIAGIEKIPTSKGQCLRRHKWLRQFLAGKNLSTRPRLWSDAEVAKSLFLVSDKWVHYVG